MFVSRDRYFIRALAGKILELENGTATEFVGNYDEYMTYKQQAKKELESIPAPAVPKNEKQKEILRNFDDNVDTAKYNQKKNFFDKMKDLFK